LERIATLLQKLLILSRILRLLRLLLDLASRHLRLRALQSCLLRTSAKTSKLLGRACAHGVSLLAKRGKLLGCLSALTILLLTKALNSLTDTKTLTIKALAKALQLLTSLLNGRTICLGCAKADTLLLLSRLKRLLIALLI
jgi:hypothetical protein